MKARRGQQNISTKNKHRFESFSSQIAKLHSLDHVKKVRRHDLETEDLCASTSYFRNAMERWTELNLTTEFTSFRREVLRLCDSLPQILLHQDAIMDLLEKYISMEEKESLEPLLDLLTAFAHDLGVRFEKHFPRSLSLVVAIASKPRDVEVIKATFACIAFLFKYLSKLLVPDLSPTYMILAPLLGKAKQPPYIARFVAEALSFLIKKVGAPSSREKALPLIVSHARGDLVSVIGTRNYELYYHSIMTMFAEALKGPDKNLHSTAGDVVLALIRDIPETELGAENKTPWTDVVCGVLTSAVHHSDTSAFAPLEAEILQFIYTRIADCSTPTNPSMLMVSTRILGTISGVQRGTRINDWPKVVEMLLQILGVICELPAKQSILHHEATWNFLIANIGVIWHHAPIDSLVPTVVKFVSFMTREPLIKWFVPFCCFFAELDVMRFKSLFQKEFHRYILEHILQSS